MFCALGRCCNVSSRHHAIALFIGYFFTPSLFTPSLKMDLHLTLSFTEAYIAKGTEPLHNHLCIPGLYRGEEEITLYLKPRIALRSADVIADGQRFQIQTDNGQLSMDNELITIDLTIKDNCITHAEVV